MSGGAASGLSIEGVGRRFGTSVVLDGVSLAVPAGGVLAVLGRSGSGKTTLLRAIAGFERVERGRISIGGRVVAGDGVHVPVERRRIGYVAQEGALFPHLTVGENVLFGLPRGLRRDGARADRWLELVGLSRGMRDRFPASLSGGEQQRVALARALATQPSLVLLDEPFSALDAGLRGETRRAVVAALRAAGATGVLVTHDQAEALSVGDAVAVLREGRIAQVGEPRELYGRPVDAALALFLGEAVVFGAEVRGGAAVGTAFGVVPLAVPVPDGRATVMLRPEQLSLGGGEGVAAVVEEVTFFGAEAGVGLALADGMRVSARVAGHLAPGVGDGVRVAVRGEAMAWPGLG